MAKKFFFLYTTVQTSLASQTPLPLFERLICMGFASDVVTALHKLLNGMKPYSLPTSLNNRKGVWLMKLSSDVVQQLCFFSYVYN